MRYKVVIDFIVSKIWWLYAQIAHKPDYLHWMKIEKQVLWRPERITERMCYMIANLINMVLFFQYCDSHDNWLLEVIDCSISYEKLANSDSQYLLNNDGKGEHINALIISLVQEHLWRHVSICLSMNT